jgi:hypothetical protein
VCVLPQLLLLRQTTVPTVIDSYYLLALGSYRGFYILNWIHRRDGCLAKEKKLRQNTHRLKNNGESPAKLSHWIS